MEFPRRLRAALVAAAAATTLGLSACGGSTVTSDDVASDTSVAPLEREAKDKDTEDKDADAESDDRAESETRAPRPDGSAAPAPRDQGAQEIEEIPDSQPGASEQDEHYVGALNDAGIDTAGYESLLVSTAWTVCSDDAVASATPGAVAGQLVAQGRTDLDEDAVVREIETNAREVYCS